MQPASSATLELLVSEFGKGNSPTTWAETAIRRKELEELTRLTCEYCGGKGHTASACSTAELVRGASRRVRQRTSVCGRVSKLLQQGARCVIRGILACIS